MKIQKAVITAAGKEQRQLPLQTLIDRDGQQKSVLKVIIEEVARAGIHDTCIVVHPDDESTFRSVAGEHARHLSFVHQPEPRGYGHAVLCAKEFTGTDPFLHLIGDHLFVSRVQKGCAQRVVETAQAESCAVSAVQATREGLLPNFGAVSGKRVHGRNDLHTIDTVIEKPTPTLAEQQLLVPGLRAGYYLCFFGIHVLTPAVMEILQPELAQSPDQRVPTISNALHQIALKEKYLALEMGDYRYNMGVKYGLLNAQLALALNGEDRNEVLAMLMEMLLLRESNAGERGKSMSILTGIITAKDLRTRDQSLDAFCHSATLEQLLKECEALEEFRHASTNLYEQVRALFFLYAIYRFHVPTKEGLPARGLISYSGYEDLLHRRFEEAIQRFLDAQSVTGSHDGISSALAAAYRSLGFQTLANQVRASVRAVRGNQWMFRAGHPSDHPLRVVPTLLRKSGSLFPLLHESTPVRMDLSHSGWSDIFFLGMDYPEGARVLNISIDLAVRQDDHGQSPRPPVEAFFRIIDTPVIRLVSTDLGAVTEVTSFGQLFDYAADYLGLLKGAVIASGIVPPSMEGANQPLADLLSHLIGPGLGIEIVSQVNGIPKGSRLAVSTTLLASIITVCMRATGQIASLTGSLTESERRTVAARAILGEWLSGSGGGWQDSGGVWPGIKLIRGVLSKEGDCEFGVSRGCLLPHHSILTHKEVSEETRRKLQESLILVHGGMAQDVGPILEMVTERYLLRSEAEWQGRMQAHTLFDQIVAQLQAGDIHALGESTHKNFLGPIQTIIPWATNLYTESIIAAVAGEFGKDFWGFWMLGGMSGGGMGFLFHPSRKGEAQIRLREIMRAQKKRFDYGIPFAMEPVVYDFTVNEKGSTSELLRGQDVVLPQQYYTLTVPSLLRMDPHTISSDQRSELEHFSSACRTNPALDGILQRIFDRILPEGGGQADQHRVLEELLHKYGFDRVQHEQIKADLRSGRIGLAQNRLPISTTIDDVDDDDVADFCGGGLDHYRVIGSEAISSGAAGVLTLAAGAGSRWTKGAGTVKALNPFCRLGGAHRSFIETHLAKSRRTMREFNTSIPHVIATGYLTHDPIKQFLEGTNYYGYAGNVHLSPGSIIGLRVVPTVRDLRFAWLEMPQQLLDEQAQKVLESLHASLMDWAERVGEAGDYTDNRPLQCLHPVGHWYEVPNLLRNGVLLEVLKAHPQLKYLLVHNIDTLGANVDPNILGYHIERGAGMTAEVITRRLEDRGGGLARAGGRLRLIEGLALPREEYEFVLSYYNTATYWLDLDRILDIFGLCRDDLAEPQKVTDAVRSVASRMPTYITLKNVKKRWGKGQEDVFPTLQYEKLWGDMTTLPELKCSYVCVPRERGQQLKEPAQMDGWLRDGSAEYVEGLCEWK